METVNNNEGFNIKSLVTKISPEQLNKLDEFLPKIVPFAESKLPMVSKLEEVWRKEFNVHPEDIFLYTAVKSPDNKKVLIYIFTGFQAPEELTFKNGRKISNGTLIISGEIKAFDMLEFIKGLTSSGLNGLIENII